MTLSLTINFYNPVRFQSVGSIVDAVAAQKMDTIVDLLARGVRADELASDGNSALHMAALRTDVPLITLLERNTQGPAVNIDVKNNLGQTALYLAIENPNPKVAEHFIAKGAKVNTTSLKGATPLHRAADLGRVELILLLLNQGADSSIKNVYGNTPYDSAMRRANDSSLSSREKADARKGADALASWAQKQQTSSPVAQAKQKLPPSTIWKHIGKGEPLTQKDKINIFVQDTDNLIDENQKIPQKSNNVLRIATYNVHYWTDPHQQPNLKAILQTIKAINADIVLLQEVSLGKTQFMSLSSSELLNALTSKLGYNDLHSFCKADNLYGAPFGNLILNKGIPEETKEEKYRASFTEGRCFVKNSYILPNSQKLSVYNVHFDVFDDSEKTRLAQINELFNETRKDSSKNILIAGDFNSVRKKHYAYALPASAKSVWDLLVENNAQRGAPTPLLIDQAIAQNGYVDSFEFLGISSPKFTVWNGTVVDYLLLNSKWNLPIQGSYVFYSTASDHLALVMDIKVK